MPPKQKSSLIYGATEPALWHKTIGDLIKEQASGSGGHRPAVIVPWQNFRSTYGELAARSRLVALSLLHHGLRHGDRIGVMAGNRYEYIDIFVGAARIGCPVVLLNNTYSPSELLNACKRSACRMVFMAENIGQVNLRQHMDILSTSRTEISKRGFILVCLDRDSKASYDSLRSYYDEFLGAGSYSDSQAILEKAESKVTPEDLINLQFTSGTTGAPKAAMLTSLNLVNNARFLGDGIRIRDGDVLCCPPPLFHCFGLVLGVLTAFTHGIPVLFPADNFDPVRTMEAVRAEKATILHGVPTMFLAELQVVAKTGCKPTTLRTCFGAGSAVTMALVKQLNEEMGVKNVLIGYGMTETSPISFMTVPEDPFEKKLSTIGRLIPHVGAKVIDQNGNVLPRGQKGELCTTGFGLQMGYLDNAVKTDEVMKKDSDGVLWMHTGDEVFIDEDGYGHITGRIKDMIIRGGENIYPGEIEERLLEHPAISEASVVGIHDAKYGEVVGAFLRLAASQSVRPSYKEIRKWVQDKMARQKAPQYLFWIGEGEGCDFAEFPKTGSGKYQKGQLREMGNKLLMEQKTMPKAKL